jgi:hypothetical protein
MVRAEWIDPAALATRDLIRGSGQRGHSTNARAGHSPEEGSSARARHCAAHGPIG